MVRAPLSLKKLVYLDGQKPSCIALERIDSLLYGLERMGYVVTANGRCRVGNWFFDRWLRSQSAPPTSRSL